MDAFKGKGILLSDLGDVAVVDVEGGIIARMIQLDFTTSETLQDLLRVVSE